MNECKIPQIAPPHTTTEAARELPEIRWISLRQKRLASFLAASLT